MVNDTTDDQALDALFEASSNQVPTVTPDFLSRLKSDAEAAVPQVVQTHAVPEGPTRFEKFMSIFAASGLSGAAALGVWIGFVMPDLVSTISPLADETATLSAFLPGADLVALSE